MKWKKYLPIIGIILFIYIIIRLNFSKIAFEISKTEPALILTAMLLVPIFLMLQTGKWFYIAKKQKINVIFEDAFIINLISNFYGFITPSKVGTITRAEYLKKYTKNIGKGVCNFTLDKILDICSVFFIAIVFLFLFREKFSFLPINFFIIIFSSLILLTLFFLRKERSKFILKIFYKRLVPKKLKEKAVLTFDSFYENLPKKRHLIIAFFLNVLTWIMTYIITFVIASSVGINLPFVYFLAVLPIGTLVSLIPITLNGLGTKEAVLISLFSLFNVGATKVFSMSILFLFITGILPAIVGGILIFKRKN